MSNSHIQSMTTQQEKAAAKRFRQKYFFDRVPVQDPYLWTFDHKDHLHYILYEADDIVGYVHIQLWPNHRAAIRIIVVDEQVRGRGLGKRLLEFCEKVLQEQGILLLQTESRRESYLFYKDLGYTEMPFNDPEGHLTHPNDIAMGKSLVPPNPLKKKD